MNPFSSPIFWAAFAGLLGIAALNSWTSRINQFFFFSRTVPAGFAQSVRGRKITMAYLGGVWLAFASGCFLLWGLLGSGRFHAVACCCTALLAQCVGACAAFARAHRLTGKALEEGVGAGAEESALNASSAIAVPLLDPGAFTIRHMVTLFLAPAAALIASGVALLASHMNAHQFSDAIDQNKASFLLGMGGGMMAASMMLYVQLRYFSRHRSPLGRFTANGCVMLAWIGAVAFSLSIASVPLHLVMTKKLTGFMLGAILIFAVARMMYGWSRACLFPPPPAERNGDKFWRWGLFYYNPGDPTLFIQHRSGPGYTMNFANMMAWPVALLIVADLIFLFFMHPHH